MGVVVRWGVGGWGLDVHAIESWNVSPIRPHLYVQYTTLPTVKAPRRVRWGRSLAAAGLAALVQMALRPWMPLGGGDGVVLTVTGSAVGGR